MQLNYLEGDYRLTRFSVRRRLSNALLFADRAYDGGVGSRTISLHHRPQTSQDHGEPILIAIEYTSNPALARQTNSIAAC